MTVDDDLGPMLRQMFEDHPTKCAPTDLARRARRLAAGHARAELQRIQRLHRWAFALTAAVFVAISGFALHVALGAWDSLTIASWTGSAGEPASSFSAATQLLIVITAAAIAAVAGAMLSGSGTLAESM